MTVEEYLSLPQEPDEEFVDGAIVTRHVGTVTHSMAQRNLILATYEWYPPWFGLPSLRIRTRPTRYRLVDLCALRSLEDTVPFAAIEILSEEDTFSGMLQKLHEYEDLGRTSG
jgi:Uma2 family endonuclease